jgi:hypothetical protein
MPKVTAGLKRPPEMRKKTQAVTAREKPKDLRGGLLGNVLVDTREG